MYWGASITSGREEATHPLTFLKAIVDEREVGERKGMVAAASQP